jgi:hypothetical protein
VGSVCDRLALARALGHESFERASGAVPEELQERLDAAFYEMPE